MRLSSLLLIFLMTGTLYGQQLELEKRTFSAFENAVKTYKLEEYAASVVLFDEYIQSTNQPRPEAYFLRATALLRVGKKSGEKDLLAAIELFPTHPMAQRGYLDLGVYYFNKQVYNKSLQYLSELRLDQLAVDEMEFAEFGLGYAHLKLGESEKAKSRFEKTRGYAGEYFIAATYYLATLHLADDQQEQALSLLLEIDQAEGPYSNEVPILIAGIYYNTDQFDRLYAYAPTKITKSVSDKNKQLNLYLGEAYFQDQDYTSSADYLQRYLDLTGKRAEATTFFKLALSYFHLEDNQNAIENFKKAGLEKGEMGQVSSYYLGQLYLKENNLNYAYSAFKNVALSDEQNEMNEEAAFTLGKINFQREQYAEAIKDLDYFISEYPSSKRKQEANELLAQSYLSTSNYDQAIAHLEAIASKSLPLRQAYQKVTFQKAQLLYNDGHFAQSIVYLRKAVSFPENKSITAEAYYLIGESSSMLNQIDEAEQAYKKCIRMSKEPYSTDSRYGLGYLYYNKKDFAAARQSFEGFVRSADKSPFYQDALVRLANCYYVAKDYSMAIENYNRVSEPQFLSYVTYQKGLIYKLINQYEQAQEAFKVVSLDRASGFADNALYQLASLMVDESKFQEAILPLNNLIEDYSGSNLVPYAKSQLALCYFNMSQFEEASQVYLDILGQHMTHEVANSALLGLQEVSKRGVAVPDFEQLMVEYQRVNPDDSSLEVIEFEAAKTNYYDQQYNLAINKFSKFLQKYPESGFVEDATYFLADAHFRSENWQQASDNFKLLVGSQSSAYLGRALDKSGKALLNLGKFDEAISSYKTLLQVARNRKESFNANEGLMKSFSMAEQLDSAIYYADIIIDSDWKPVNAESSIILFKAKIFIEREEYSLALDELIKVINDTPSERGAEASYMMARIYYEQEQHKQSLESLFQLNKTFASYPYWIGKSFLLIADNYIAMEELLQAKATTESIIQNASIDEIRQEAIEKLELINAKEQELLIPADSSLTDSIK